MVYGRYGSGVGDSVGGRLGVDVESCVAVGSGVSVIVAVAVRAGTAGAQAASVNKNKTANQNLLFILSPGWVVIISLPGVIITSCPFVCFLRKLHRRSRPVKSSSGLLP